MLRRTASRSATMSCPATPEDPERLAAPDVEVDSGDRLDLAVALGQAADNHGRVAVALGGDRGARLRRGGPFLHHPPHAPFRSSLSTVPALARFEARGYCRGVVRILAVADEVDESLGRETMGSLRPDVVVSCGDLPFDHLEYLVTLANVPLLYVRGN